MLQVHVEVSLCEDEQSMSSVCGTRVMSQTLGSQMLSFYFFFLSRPAVRLSAACLNAHRPTTGSLPNALDMNLEPAWRLARRMPARLPQEPPSTSPQSGKRAGKRKHTP
eukprot:3419713-Amphidinium_carterae.1